MTYWIYIIHGKWSVFELEIKENKLSGKTQGISKITYFSIKAPSIYKDIRTVSFRSRI